MSTIDVLRAIEADAERDAAALDGRTVGEHLGGILAMIQALARQLRHHIERGDPAKPQSPQSPQSVTLRLFHGATFECEGWSVEVSEGDDEIHVSDPGGTKYDWPRDVIEGLFVALTAAHRWEPRSGSSTPGGGSAP